VGMLKALEEKGIRPDLILGTSIGAFNGSVVAAQPGIDGVDRLVQIWKEIAASDLFSGGSYDRFKAVATLQPAMHGSAALRAMLEQVHDADSRIEDLVIPFQCVAASIERAAEHWFTEGPLIDALLATSAVPLLFPPIEINEEHFYDGGLVNSVPLRRAVKLRANVVYVLQVGRVEAPLRPPDRLYEAALISFEIARRHTFATAMQEIPDDVDVHLLPSGNPVMFDDWRQLRWRDTGSTEELMEGAYEASTSYLKGM
jgi:NTE family protein